MSVRRRARVCGCVRVCGACVCARARMRVEMRACVRVDARACVCGCVRGCVCGCVQVFGGRFIPETLMVAHEELEVAWNKWKVRCRQ